MSDEEPSEDAETEVDAGTIEDQLAAAREELEAAETEDDLDVVAAELDKVEGLLESAELPESDDDEEGPREELEGELSDLRDQLEEARGPYADDVIAAVEDAASTVEDERWTEAGSEEIAAAVESFVGEVRSILDNEFGAPTSDDPADLADALSDAAAAVGAVELHPDEDAETIAALLEESEALADEIEGAETWDDLSVREKLDAQGFFDVLDHRKDFPPEWHALKVWEKRGRVDMVLLALDLMDSNFMEEHCLEALERMASEEALDPMLDRAQKRDKDAIAILGKIGSEEALDTILEFVDADPALSKRTLKAVGEIGSEEATQTVANRLDSDREDVRSHAARALGLIGDTRAVEPLADALANDESDTVRASAAWALNQVGTERARSKVREYADDRAFLVQTEAEKAL